MIEAILWDFGGVFTTSPFVAFDRFQRTRRLPANFIRTVNSTNPDTNAWARFESSLIDEEQFDVEFRREAEALGHSVGGKEVLGLLSGDFRPRMAKALAECKKHYKVGCITNNMKKGAKGRVPIVRDLGAPAEERKSAQVAEVMASFEVVIESSVEGMRKPDPRIYRIACERLGIAPDRTVFLDDLGINLKPARAMGMTTIKVVTEDQALDELAAATGLTFP